MTETPDRRRRKLHGRRVGKPLKPRQAALIETLLPRIRVPVARDAGGRVLPLDPGALFGRPMSALRLEIGFGGGEHLAARAAEFPDTGFIGCEPFLNGAAKMLAQIEAGGLANVRVWDGDARDVLDALPDGAIDHVDLLYPDPWPKLRHHKRRFVQADTRDALARTMKPGALLCVATDIPDYARWTLQQLIPDRRFRWLARAAADWRTPFPGWPGTRYEAKALRAGRAPIYLTFRREA